LGGIKGFAPTTLFTERAPTLWSQWNRATHMAFIGAVMERASNLQAVVLKED